jgi:Flp pilus assembly protein TadG
MIRIALRVWRDRRGAGIIEFALVAPLLLVGIIGAVQLGTLFFANAGLRSSVAEGARYATTYPQPTNAQIVARMTKKRFGPQASEARAPVITTGTSDAAGWVQISQSSAVSLDFVFFSKTVLLTETRRAFVYPTY